MNQVPSFGSLDPRPWLDGNDVENVFFAPGTQDLRFLASDGSRGGRCGSVVHP